MNPNQGQQGLGNMLGGGQGTQPPEKFNLQKLYDSYQEIQKMKQYASPSLKQMLDQIPHPIHPDYHWGLHNESGQQGGGY